PTFHSQRDSEPENAAILFILHGLGRRRDRQKHLSLSRANPLSERLTDETSAHRKRTLASELLPHERNQRRPLLRPPGPRAAARSDPDRSDETLRRREQSLLVLDPLLAANGHRADQARHGLSGSIHLGGGHADEYHGDPGHHPDLRKTRDRPVRAASA